MGEQNYYELLGVSMEATQEEIKKVYKNKAKQYHPDNNPDANATAIFQSITKAYEVLSDASLRRKYDNELRHDAKNNASTKEPSSHYTSQTHTPYSSYTKTREESEYDFDDWLKEYLKIQRKKNDYINDIDSLINLKNDLINIDNIYKQYIKYKEHNYNFNDREDEANKKIYILF